MSIDFLKTTGFVCPTNFQATDGLAKRVLMCFGLILISYGTYGQHAERGNSSVLSIAEVMKGERFTGYSPQDVEWDVLSSTIFFSWNPEMEIIRSTFHWQIESEDGPQKTSPEIQATHPSSFSFNSGRTKAIFTLNGDLYLQDIDKDTIHRLSRTAQTISNPVFSGDDLSVVYRLDGNLYRRNLESGYIEQMIKFKSGNPARESAKKPEEEWLKKDQIELFETLAMRKERRDMREKHRAAIKETPIPVVYAGGQSVSNQQLSPDGRFVSYQLTKRPEIANTDVPNYVTESGQVETIRSRPKVGHPQPTHEFWIFDLKRDSSYKVSINNVPGIRKKPDFLRDYHRGERAFEVEFDGPRPVVIHGPHFSDSGQAVVIVRSLDNKDRWIMGLDMETGELKLLDHQRDEAWIGGPGISSWNFTSGTIGWMKDDLHIYFQSEETGFSHLYKVNTETGKKTALTFGNWEVLTVELSHDGKTFFITANKESPFEHHFYHLPASGGELLKITNQRGGHRISISPDQKHLAVEYSSSDSPWELFYMENKPNAEYRQLTHSTTEEFTQYDWIEPEIIWFEAQDGVMVPARIYEPEEARNNGAAIVFVHGAGYLQNVHQWWSSYFREYMFHHILRDNGYTVLDIDFRASAGYGRDWRTAIYRHMGGKDLSDQVDGARWLIENKSVHPGKIGIYGGSYGGFISIMAMFLEPETFAAGAALRSVTDWAHYNHGYTSNILNTPVEDSIAFRRSSPIYHAEGLQGALLMLHGIIDINVQYQDVVRLAQRLIELEKDNWDLAVYPLEDHGFIEASAWTDEYRRIFNWFQRHLLGQ